MNNYDKATLIANEISDEEPFAQSDAVQCLASEFLILKQRFEKADEYKALLNQCLNCLNEMPNRYIKERFMTYDLAAKIETLLRA